MPRALEFRSALLCSALLVTSCEARATMGCNAARAGGHAYDAQAVIEVGESSYLAAKVGPIPGPGIDASVEAANVRLGLAARRLAEAQSCELRS